MTTQEKVQKLVKANNFKTCQNCAFYLGNNSYFCFAPWSDGQIEDEGIDPCYEGVYRYITGKPSTHLQALIDRNVGYLHLRENESHGL